MATTAAPYGFWATNPTEKLAHWVYLSGQPLSRNRVFQNFSGEPTEKVCEKICIYLTIRYSYQYSVLRKNT